MIQANRAHVKEGKKDRKWAKWVVLGAGIYLTIALGRGVLELQQAYKRIDEAKKILAEEQNKSQTLKRKWEEVQTTSYIERVARNDLNMQKDGETVVLLPPKVKEAEASQPQITIEKELPNYLKWWNLVK